MVILLWLVILFLCHSAPESYRDVYRNGCSTKQRQQYTKIIQISLKMASPPALQRLVRKIQLDKNLQSSYLTITKYCHIVIFFSTFANASFRSRATPHFIPYSVDFPYNFPAPI